MSQRIQIAFVAVFCFCIYSVAIIQAAWELANGETVQMLDIVGDTFAAPARRANAIAGLLDSLGPKCDAVEQQLAGAAGEEEYDWEGALSAAEEVMFAAGDARKSVVTINRHVEEKPSGVRALRADSLRRAAQQLYDACSDEDPATAQERLAEVRAHVSRMSERYLPATAGRIPGLVWKAFWTTTVFSRTYLRAWENEMEETSIAADMLRPPNQFLRFALMHDLGEKAVLGRKGWFFYRPGVEYLTYPSILDPRSQPDTTTNIIDESPVQVRDDPVGTIVTFRDQLAAQGVELLVVIVPGKGSVYPDMVNASVAPDEACRFSHSVGVLEELERRGVAVVDLFHPFAEERTRDEEAGDSLYLSKDTHWRARGLRLCARLVAERIRGYEWYDPEWETTEYVLEQVDVDRVGDVGTMTALPDFRVRELKLAFGVESTACFQVYRVQRDDEGNEARRVLYRDDFNRANVLVLGDSFSRIYQTDEPRMAGWIAHLAYELRQPVCSFVSDGGASTLVRQTLARALSKAKEEGKRPVLAGKKLVVWEFIERDLRFGAEGWQDVAIEM